MERRNYRETYDTYRTDERPVRRKRKKKRKSHFLYFFVVTVLGAAILCQSTENRNYRESLLYEQAD